jgi:hypothetical protein
MMPFVLDLPPIYKGCTWPAITLQWKAPGGAPMVLWNWTPYCTTKHFSLNPVVVDAQNGVTRISLSKLQTAALKLGTEQWDWVWLNHFDTYIHGPFLSGRVEIRQPLASTDPVT